MHLGEAKSRKAAKLRSFWAKRQSRHYFVHSLIGRAANDALSRVLALRISRLRGGNAIATPDDYGFVLTVSPSPGLRRGRVAEVAQPGQFRRGFARGPLAV